MFCATRLVFEGTEVVRSRFHIVSLPNSFSTVPRASSPVFMCCAPGLVFDGAEGDGAEGVGYRGHQTLFSCFALTASFQRCRVCRVPFSCVARPNSFSAVPRRPVPFSNFTRSDTFSAFPRASGPFSFFARPDLFSTIPRALGPVFMIYAPEIVFDCTEVVGYCFFLFLALGLVFGSTKGVVSHFHIWRSRTRFRRYRGCRVPFSCFTCPDSFSAVPSVLGPVFMLSASEVVFGGIEGVGYRFHVLSSRTRFQQHRGRRDPFSCFVLSDSFSCFARQDSFSTIPRVSGIVFMFCAP
jgi:hypothetical protein